EVEGHKKGQDDNNSDKKPEDNKTSVDESGKKPVKPTDEKQDTGVKVTNPDKDTKVTAKDEDGKDVPAEIDENGNIVVTPGKDVDGPIDVTVTDPDLPGGKVEVEVEVEGHKKGQDDNNSDKKPEDNKTSVDESGKKPVKPTDDKQDTGVKVTNPDKDTKVSAKDEDGKDIPVEIDENGNIVVTPGTDVDGPIDITIEDPDLPGGKVEIEIEVEGHKKGQDDNNSDKKPEDNKTSVDESGKKPVKPTDDKQDTGVKVTNPDKDTKVTAKDEDGKDVPAEINENGNIVVTPGKDVDGPIDVTVEDPDLPGGKVEIEVEVEGHKKGQDDNNSDKKPEDKKTSVDESGKKSVKPTDDKQDTGVKVTNPDKDTKVKAKDEDGKDIPAEIDEDGKVIVTPGTDVDGPITVVVEDPDLPGGKVEIEVPVEGHEKGRDDNGSDKTIADKIEPIIPEKTEVGRPGLTQSERDEVERKINEANKDNFPEGTKVVVDESGNATIIYPDGSIDTIPWNKLVYHRDDEGAAESDKPSDEASDKDSKGTEEAGHESGSKEQSQADAATLPQTGENDSTVIFGAAALSILAGLGLVASRRKEEE
ncbi:LPXTG cell wall anchor domain-containing protein, partial [Facklamia hominis]